MDQVKNNSIKAFEKYQDTLSRKNKVKRALWNVSSLILFKPFGLPCFKKWRNTFLRMWGSEIGSGSSIHASAQIWAPWNLVVGCRTCIGPHAIIYNPGKIKLGNKVVISQYAYLCAASHEYESKSHKLCWKEIVVGDYAWVAADAFVCMGVTIGEGAVVGARAAVFKNVESWTVVGGNPARFIKKRNIKD